MPSFISVPTKRLANSITTTDYEFTIRNNEGWDGETLQASDFDSPEYGVFRNETNTRIEFFSFDPADIADGEITILNRGLPYSGDLTTEIDELKENWIKGETLVELGSDPSQLFQYLKDYIDNGLQSGAADATESIKGISEIATDAEIDAGTTAGSTGARLVVPADARNNLSNDEKDAVAGFTGVILPYGGSSAPTGYLLCDGSAVSRTTYSTLFGVISTSYGAGDGSTTFNVPDLRSSFPVGAGQKVVDFEFSDSDVDTTNDTITVDSNDYLHTGQEVALSSTGTLPSGLSAQSYYVIRVDATTIKLATSRGDADDSNAVDITGATGGGTHTAKLTLSSRAIGDEGGEEDHQLTTEEIPSHSHSSPADSGNGLYMDDNSDSPYANGNTGATGGDQPHNNMPPYQVVNYIIKT